MFFLCIIWCCCSCNFRQITKLYMNLHHYLVDNDAISVAHCCMRSGIDSITWLLCLWNFIVKGPSLILWKSVFYHIKFSFKNITYFTLEILTESVTVVNVMDIEWRPLFCLPSNVDCSVFEVGTQFLPSLLNSLHLMWESFLIYGFAFHKLLAFVSSHWAASVCTCEVVLL